MIVIMDGLSLNTLQTMADEQKLLNFNWIRENGVVGRLTTFKPDFELSLLNTLLSGCPPSAYDVHSDFKYQFRTCPGSSTSPPAISSSVSWVSPSGLV